MKSFKHSLLIVALPVCLASCGGGGSGASTPASVAPTAAANAATCGMANFEAHALSVVNSLRARGATCGALGYFPPAPALTWDSRLQTAASNHARDMSTYNYVSHDNRDGSPFDTRVTAAGYDWTLVGENLAASFPSIDAVLNAWYGSPEHCVNMMNPGYKEVGMACAPSSAGSAYTNFWVQDFGRR